MPDDKQMLESALLVTRWQRGDRTAFEGLVKLWEQPLFYYLRRLANSEADAWELLQETWLKILRSLKTLRDPMALPSFLYTTARNTAINRLRGTKYAEQLDALDNEDKSQTTDEANALDDAEQVHHALDQLPILQREALTLFFLQDLTLEEMSRVLGVPLGTVKSRVHYAKVAIRKILIQGENHDG
jgi:RNA polymerase sigma-70 factor (ECF subfamily)